MRKVPISQFTAKCSFFLRRVQKTRRPILVTRFGKLVAEVVPPSPKFAGNWIGSMRDKIKILGDIVSPANDLSDWEVLRD
jgi:antitoxin (DNA-binding transcriptional repressor) of toxin-antitoxin stability system